MQNISNVQVAKNILVRAEIGSGGGLRTGIFCAGGAQTGAFGAGVLHYMHDMGLFDKLDFVFGSSASAPNCGFFLSGKGPDGISFYWEENCSGFINPMRFWKIVDLEKLERAMRHTKVLDTMGVRENPTKFYVTLTDLNGNGELCDVKSCPDIIVPIVASCGLPIYWNRPRSLNGKAYLDGAIALPLPIFEIAAQFQLTDLLVIINQRNTPEIEDRSWLEKLAARCLLRPYSKNLEEAYLNRKRKYNVGLQEANSGRVGNGTEGRCRVALIAPSYSISKHCTEVGTLKAFAEEGRRAARDFFRR